MAKMLSKQNSTPLFLRSTLRHIRLCNRIYGDNKYSQAINPLYETLQEKYDRYEMMKLDRYFASDNLFMCDHMLDNDIRTSHESCNQYERENNDAFLLDTFFPNGRFGDIIRKSKAKELNIVEQLALKFETLGDQHPLFKLAAELREGISKVRRAMEEYNEAIREEKLALAEVDIAKEALRKQYAKNYFDAKQEKGRVKADFMFPAITSKLKEVPVEEISDTPDQTAQAA